ncbi:glycosyltransferase [Candidatus Saccharibacteria bacterium]|nr:glycosyltransferase [Candidatus Saccharibacteria bacterium]
MKIAIVCDWIAATGGSERVIKALHEIFPDAPIYTSTYNVQAVNTLFGKNVDLRASWMQKLPKFLRRHQLLTIPRQWYFGHLKLKGYDVVFSAGSAEAKAVRAPDGVHINMCYTPTLYYWVKPENYLTSNNSDSINWLWRIGLKILLPFMRHWDMKASQRPDKMYAISTAVQQRIKNIYKRVSEILHPPVETDRFKNDGRNPKSGFITWGRHVSHKRLDLAIMACNEARKPLVVLGDGPEHERLVNMAGPNITFRTKVSDDDMVNYISRAEAFIFPNEEDFGIVSLEAQAAGIPVIAYRAGGSLDTVVERVTGEFFDKQNVETLSKKLKDFNYKLYNRSTIIANAERFSTDVFRENVLKIVNKATNTKH